jgi:DNA polymerase-3 subunit beta
MVMVAEAPVRERTAKTSSRKRKKNNIELSVKLVCDQSELEGHLALAYRAVPGHPSHPILKNVLLEADVETQTMRLTGFDLSMGIETTVDARVEIGGKVAIPGRLLNDIVSRLPSGEVTLWCSTKEDEGETLGEKLSVGLEYASGQVQLSGISPEEFPRLPQVDGRVIYLPQEALLEGLRGTLFATSSDETKQVLTGVHVTLEKDKVEFASTDGHRLAVVKATTNSGEDGESESVEETEESGAEAVEVTIPAKALREVERLLGTICTSSGKGKEESEEQPLTPAVEMRFEPGQLIFKVDNYKVSTRTLEGQYPPYRQLIPRQFLRQITVERRQLLNTVERIAILADQKNNIVKFSIDATEQQMVLSVEAADVGNGRESVPAEVSGESIDVAFNIKYVIDALKSISTSDVMVQMNGANMPVIVTPIGGQLQKLVLLMPCQLRA